MESHPSTSAECKGDVQMETDEILSEQEHLFKELRVFLDGATKISKVRSIEVAKAAIYVLKHTRAVSDAVLEHMDNLFDESVNNYILNLELESNVNVANNVAEDENILKEVCKVLSEFIKSDPESWAPLISSWSLNLLGCLGSKYADRRVVPHSSNLPEVLKLWLTCQPTRSLIDLAIQCLSTLINTNPDSCIDALIETSVKHSPHFDWVVANIGSWFPMTVITRVLACGLKDYCMHQETNEELQLNMQKRMPKIDSVVKILAHLAMHHNSDMRTAIHALINESLCNSASREQLATGPFLLHLASMNDTLSDVISSEFVKVVNPETLNMMSGQVEKWKSAKIPGTDGLVHLVVCLLLRSDGGSQVIRRLLDIIPPSSIKIHTVIQNAAGLVLDSVLFEIQRQVYSGSSNIPLLKYLKMHIADLSSNLSDTEGKKASWVFNLIKLICIHGEEPFTVFILGHLLTNTERVAKYISALAQEIQMSQPNALCTTISHQMAELKSGRVQNPVVLVKNVTSLCQIEQLQKLIIDGVGPNLEVLAAQISQSNESYSDALIELMSLAVVTEKMKLTAMYKVGVAVCNYFFRLLQRKDIGTTKKKGLVNIVKTLLGKLCKQSGTQHMILRMILEGLLDDSYCYLLEMGGSKAKSSFYSSDIMLLDENAKYSASISLPPNHCSVFYSGVIGTGLRQPQKIVLLPKDEVLLNKQFVLDIIRWCCGPTWRFPLDDSPNVHPQSLVPGMKIVALLMVELISPDVMFNGLPWPDEDYIKVTIERDLHIKQVFETHTILWDILLLVATTHPSLCYCSVLLRAIMAVLISHWSSNQEKSTRNSPKQLQMTQKLINIMAIGQILPPPLSFMDEVLPLVTPYEAFSLLTNIWQYMRDNVPSPALFSQSDPNNPRMWRNFNDEGCSKNNYCEKKYTNRLRFIMFANIEKFGSMYGKFFPIEL